MMRARAIAPLLLILGCLSGMLGSTMARSTELIVTYATDLEGSWRRFLQFLSENEAFEMGRDGLYHLKDGAYFVFGGDAPDRFLGSKRVVEELVRLKRETPHRVILIMGNRDINKMRLTSELAPYALELPANKFHFTREADWQKHAQPESRAERLKYIFASTMGAPDAFELRHQEISAESDDAVAASILEELGPEGKFREMLELGQLAFRIENTLFVHGGITRENLGFIPGDPRRRAKLDEWIADLNNWLQVGVEIWKARDPNDGTPLAERPEQDWLDYPMVNAGMNSKPESVVTGRNTNHRNNPFLPDAELREELLAQGVERVVIGHTPTGDGPLIMRTLDDRFEAVSADNSRAKSEDYASVVTFKGEGLKRTVTQSTVVLDGGREVKVVADVRIGTPTLIGKRIGEDEGLIFGRIASEPGTLVKFHYGEKFKTFHEPLSEADVNREQAAEPVSECELRLERRH